MAKKAGITRKVTRKRRKQSGSATITLRYDLYDLPTSQHKAGLAGLLLQINSMRERRDAGALSTRTEIPRILSCTSLAAEIVITEQSASALFNDLYDAEIVEQQRRQKQKNKQPKRIEEIEVPDRRTGAVKKEKRYVYDVVQPLGHFLRLYMDNGKAMWHKLWRDMLFAVPRNRPTTWGPFNARAKGKPVKDGIGAWKALLAHEKARARGGVKMVGVAEAIMLAAQSVNAEVLKFEDRADHALLLHFWPLVCRVFVPEQIDNDGNREFKGYVIAVPEIRDLTGFCDAHIKLLNELSSQKHGYLPKDAIISAPEQGSLEFMRQIDELAQRRAIRDRSGRYVSNIEYYYAIKAGNNAKMVTHGRIPPDLKLLNAYDGIRSSARNVLFQSARIASLLRARPWFAEFDAPLHERDWSFFVHSMQERHRTPPAMISFANDARRRFKTLVDNYRTLKEARMPAVDEAADSVDRLVYELVHKYVRIRACAKAGVNETDDNWWTKTAEERRDVASKLFLELRSRSADDFVRHFTTTIGSVPQWLDESRFLAVADALMRDHTDKTGEDRPRTRDDVKTLALLALSAASRSLRQLEGQEQDTTSKEESS